MKFETLKAGDYIEAHFYAYNGGWGDKYWEVTGTVKYISPEFALIVDNEGTPYIVYGHRFKKIKQAKVL